MFAGKLFYCDTSAIAGVSARDLESLIKNEKDCINYGGEWVKWWTNFDDLKTSMIQMFGMAQTVGWEITMIRGMKSQGIRLTSIAHPPYGNG